MRGGASCLRAPVALSASARKQLAPQHLYTAKLLPKCLDQFSIACTVWCGFFTRTTAEPTVRVKDPHHISPYTQLQTDLVFPVRSVFPVNDSTNAHRHSLGRAAGCPATGNCGFESQALSFIGPQEDQFPIRFAQQKESPRLA